ncbi:uncharacterized protein LOC124446826 isoform X2 [Xenia sp. Carnegie-2017]|uniref:uncharacterized protein LOC124446826 isoform X2 n=1 Tax=Xenia sp. Carnegie-2017 TaxID=2897299 RepID=UPI001F03CAF6|nr:uncharacterized protein LOC124446826 isoform X2 [Xenia sp. Carnegie-2017]
MYDPRFTGFTWRNSSPYIPRYGGAQYFNKNEPFIYGSNLTAYCQPNSFAFNDNHLLNHQIRPSHSPFLLEKMPASYRYGYNIIPRSTSAMRNTVTTNYQSKKLSRASSTGAVWKERPAYRLRLPQHFRPTVSQEINKFATPLPQKSTQNESFPQLVKFGTISQGKIEPQISYSTQKISSLRHTTPSRKTSRTSVFVSEGKTFKISSNDKLQAQTDCKFLVHGNECCEKPLEKTEASKTISKHLKTSESHHLSDGIIKCEVNSSLNTRNPEMPECCTLQTGLNESNTSKLSSKEIIAANTTSHGDNVAVHCSGSKTTLEKCLRYKGKEEKQLSSLQYPKRSSPFLRKPGSLQEYSPDLKVSGLKPDENGLFYSANPQDLSRENTDTSMIESEKEKLTCKMNNWDWGKNELEKLKRVNGNKSVNENMRVTKELIQNDVNRETNDKNISNKYDFSSGSCAERSNDLKHIHHYGALTCQELSLEIDDFDFENEVNDDYDKFVTDLEKSGEHIDADKLLVSLGNRKVRINSLLEEQKRLMESLEFKIR